MPCTIQNCRFFFTPEANIFKERTWNVLRKCLYSFPVVQGLICCHSYRVICLPVPFRTAAPNGMLFSVSYPLEIPKLPALKSVELHRDWFNHHVWTLCRIYIARPVFWGYRNPFWTKFGPFWRDICPWEQKNRQFWIVQGTVLGYCGLNFGSKWVSTPTKYIPGNADSAQGPNMVIEPIPEELDTF